MASLRNLGLPGELSNWQQSSQCSSRVGLTCVSRSGSVQRRQPQWWLTSLPIVHRGLAPPCLLQQHNTSPSVNHTQPFPRQCRHLLFLPHPKWIIKSSMLLQRSLGKYLFLYPLMLPVIFQCSLWVELCSQPNFQNLFQLQDTLYICFPQKEQRQPRGGRDGASWHLALLETWA